MRFLNVPFILLTISTIIGIVLGNYLTTEIEIVLLFFFVCCCLLGIIWKVIKRPFSSKYLFTVFTSATFVLFGLVLVKIHNPSNYATHYTHHIQEQNSEHKKGIQFTIRERLKPTSFYNTYIAVIKRIDSKVVNGLLLLKIPKANASSALEIGLTYTCYTKIQPIPEPLNPAQFNYAHYLEKQYIYHRIIVQPNQLSTHHTAKWSFLQMADKARKHINNNLSEHRFTTNQLSILNALLLGQRQDISKQVFEEYRDAGAIHILAMSGLHVGIILMILNYLLQPLEHIRRHGKTIKLVLIITLLWCFAIIAGLSPSILRAATMFSFLAIGIYNRSETSVYNSLFISMFLLLCFRPMFIFSVGFQLSYLAVFAIVWIQPILAKIYRPKYLITKKLWETFTVTIAAQLGLLPLLLFYFHQFPLLFFVSNLIIIPFLGGILGFGIFVISLALFGILPESLASLFGNCIDTMNNIISWVASHESMVLRDIPFSLNMLIIFYYITIILVLIFKKFKLNRVYLMVFGIACLLFTIRYEKHILSNKDAFIVFHNQGNSTLGILENQKLNLYHQKTLTTSKRAFLFNNFLVNNRAVLDTTFVLKNTYQYKKHTILIIDSTGIYNIKAMRPDIIILSGSPKIHLNRVIDSLQPRQIVADGNNYKSYLDQWEKSCLALNISFYRTDKMGAFIISSD